MGKGLDGVAKENWTLCSPECTIHERDEYVSQRTRRRCDERIELENLKHATLQQTQTPQPSANQPEYPEPMSAELEAALSAFVDSLAAELEPPLPAQSDLAYEDDITMPTWGMPFGEGGFEYGGQDNAAGESDDDLPAAQSSEADPENDSGADQLGLSPTYDIAAEWSTDVGYSSGTEADVDSDVESNAELDNLIPISPTLSPRPLTPEVIEMDLGDLEFHGTEAPPIPASPASPAPPDNSASGEPDPALHFDPTTPITSTDLPDALRAYRELILKLATDGDLTVVAANAMLKTLNMCLDKDLLRCGPEANPAHRLPATLETLKKQVSEPSDVMKIHIMCPNFSCQTLKELSSLDLDKPHMCSKCKNPITRQKTIRRRGSGKVVYRHIPFYQYGAGITMRQLRSIVERPGNLEAIDRHRENLRREGRPDGVLRDIQDGELWRNFKKGDTKFFDNPHNIGLILMCDGFSPATRKGAASYSMTAISLCIANLPPDLRNRPENKILVGVTPGPHEPNVDTINSFLKPMVDELKELWKDGMTITKPDGSSEVIYVALVACACDTPAARKVGGFPGVSARHPCTACWCSHRELHIYDKEFPRRSRLEHKLASKAYKTLSKQSHKDSFISARYENGKPGGYRYSVLLRLPYWDPSTLSKRCWVN